MNRLRTVLGCASILAWVTVVWALSSRLDPPAMIAVCLLGGGGVGLLVGKLVT